MRRYVLPCVNWHLARPCSPFEGARLRSVVGPVVAFMRRSSGMHLVQLVPIALVVVWLLWRYRRQRQRQAQTALELDVEVRVLVGLATYLAHERSAAEIRPAHLLLAAVQNRGMADALAQAGIAPAEARQSLHDLDGSVGFADSGAAAGDPPLDDDDPIPWDLPASAPRSEWDELAELGLSPELLEALKQAAQRAFRRHSPTLALEDLVWAMAQGPSELAHWLRRIDLASGEMEAVGGSQGPAARAHDNGVCLVNDGVSSMDDVTRLLEDILDMPPDEAKYTMLTVHHRGYARLGPYPPEQAEQLRQRIARHAAERGMSELQITAHAPDTTRWQRTTGGLLPQSNG